MMSILAMDLDELHRELDAPGTLPSRAADIRSRIDWLEALDPGEPVRGEWDSPGTSPE
jgi:hypothetical protein